MGLGRGGGGGAPGSWVEVRDEQYKSLEMCLCETITKIICIDLTVRTLIIVVSSYIYVGFWFRNVVFLRNVINFQNL